MGRPPSLGSDSGSFAASFGPFLNQVCAWIPSALLPPPPNGMGRMGGGCKGGNQTGLLRTHTWGGGEHTHTHGDPFPGWGAFVNNESSRVVFYCVQRFLAHFLGQVSYMS